MVSTAFGASAGEEQTKKEAMRRDELLKAIQDYAEEWKTGQSGFGSPAKVALYIALDRYEAKVIEIAQRKSEQPGGASCP